MGSPVLAKVLRCWVSVYTDSHHTYAKTDRVRYSLARASAHKSHFIFTTLLHSSYGCACVYCNVIIVRQG